MPASSIRPRTSAGGARVDRDVSDAGAGVVDGLDGDDEHGITGDVVEVAVGVACGREQCVDRFVE